jgi:AraC-like DNA-binding protein
MGSRLDVVTDFEWEQAARLAGYRVRQLAAIMTISPRQLRSYFLRRFRCDPKIWLARRRADRASQLLVEGRPAKQVATTLGFSSASSFRVFFKQFTGRTVGGFIQNQAIERRELRVEAAAQGNATLSLWTASRSTCVHATVAWTEMTKNSQRSGHLSCQTPPTTANHTKGSKTPPIIEHHRDCSRPFA